MDHTDHPLCLEAAEGYVLSVSHQLAIATSF